MLWHAPELAALVAKLREQVVRPQVVDCLREVDPIRRDVADTLVVLRDGMGTLAKTRLMSTYGNRMTSAMCSDALFALAVIAIWLWMRGSRLRLHRGLSGSQTSGTCASALPSLCAHQKSRNGWNTLP